MLIFHIGVAFTIFKKCLSMQAAAVMPVLNLTAAPNSPKQHGLFFQIHLPSTYQHFLQKCITRCAAVVGHLGREIPPQLIFYCINESHLDQTVS